MSTVEVLRQIRDLNGQEVDVEGWIEPCSVYDCMLFANKADLEMVQQGKAGSKEWLNAMNRGLSVGEGSWWFNWRADSLRLQRVVIRARVNDECRDPTGKIACFDRADDLQPISVHAAPPQEKVN